MKTRNLVFSAYLALLVLFTAGTALAEVVLTTDKPTYEIGEIVHLTAHNAGPEDEEFNSAPYFLIYYVDGDVCILGCLGLPVITPFPAGETVTMTWDTGESPDAPGHYSVGLAMGGSPVVDYFVTEPVDVEAASWGALKVLYR